ncbi:MAG: hypothetical protein ACRDOB_16350, partial [Streptosporangiaceae bacterium]
VSGDWTSYWVYVVGPIAGALIAVGFALVLRGRGGDVISRAAGSGVLDQGFLTARSKLAQDIEQGKVVPTGIADTGAQRNGPLPLKHAARQMRKVRGSARLGECCRGPR